MRISTPAATVLNEMFKVATDFPVMPAVGFGDGGRARCILDKFTGDITVKMPFPEVDLDKPRNKQSFVHELSHAYVFSNYGIEITKIHTHDLEVLAWAAVILYMKDHPEVEWPVPVENEVMWMGAQKVATLAQGNTLRDKINTMTNLRLHALLGVKQGDANDCA